jgi:hypothetical protein
MMIVAIVRERRFAVDVGNRSVGGGHDRDRLVRPFVALQAADINAFMHLPAFGADATEAAALPRFADGGNEEPFAAAVRVKEGAVRGGQLKTSAVRGRGNQTRSSNRFDFSIAVIGV